MKEKTDECLTNAAYHANPTDFRCSDKGQEMHSWHSLKVYTLPSTFTDVNGNFLHLRTTLNITEGNSCSPIISKEVIFR